ncbi:MAG TPA: cytochrome c [Bryobacteraceae bacterium]|nr:cytochrome c [Bryobacteraceae bacterium]
MIFRAAILLGLGATILGAHDIITTKITWSKEMSRLVYKRCAMCHRDGGAAFSLMTYEAARPWAKAIKEEALERRMPPWQAVKGFGEFKDDRGLTQEELEVISDWVEGGAPEGEPKFLPPVPKPVDWLDPVQPARSAEVDVAASTKLRAAARVVAIRAKNLKKGDSVQVLAMRPDGTFAPLLWIYQFNPDFARTYYYKAPVELTPGTRIVMSPENAGTFALFTSLETRAGR